MEPLSAFDGRLVVSGEALVTLAPGDDAGFNTTDYDRNALRLVRLGLVSAFRATDRLSLLMELRGEGDSGSGRWGARPYAAYLSVRPTAGPALELQIGRIASAFGGFTRRSYGADNPLIGYPLAYQYLTSLRQDTVPASADHLLAARGSGAYGDYDGAGPWVTALGVPIASAFRYDTGVLARVRRLEGRLEALGSLTMGSLSHPGSDGNGGPQFAGRVAWRPVPALGVGASVARGDFLSDRAASWTSGTPGGQTYGQQAYGADLEYSRDYWLVRSEVVTSRWEVPPGLAPTLPPDLRASSWLVEGRYTVAPGAYVAARVDTLWFSEIRGSYARAPWDANVWRTEVGVGYALARHLRLKVAVQHSRRDGWGAPRQTLGAVQALAWF
jgi:hypothetical protein